MNRPAITLGAETSITSIPAVSLKAANKASAVNAADPMAKPLPIAAVVFPTASSLSVRCLTSGGSLTFPQFLLRCPKLARMHQLQLNTGVRQHAYSSNCNSVKPCKFMGSDYRG